MTTAVHAIGRAFHVLSIAGALLMVAPPAAAQVIDAKIVVTRTTVTTSGHADVSARCPTGYVAVSGGVDAASPWTVTTLAPTFGNLALFQLANGTQPGAPDGWYASLDVTAAPSTIGFAVSCAKLAGAAVTVVGSGQAAYRTDTMASAECPSGYSALGGGIDVDGASSLAANGFRISADHPLDDNSDLPYPPAIGWLGGVFGAFRIFVVEPPPGPVFKVGAICAQGAGTAASYSYGIASAAGVIVRRSTSCAAGSSAIAGGIKNPGEWLVGLQPVLGDDAGLELYQRAAGTYPVGQQWVAAVVREPAATNAGDSFNGYAVCAVTGAPAATPVSVTSSSNPAVFGQSLVYTATVSGGSTVPIGTVSFADGGTTLCAGVPLASGKAQCATGPQTVIGVHPIMALYSGDSALAGATGTLNQSIDKAGTVVTLTGHAPSPSTTLDKIMVTASLAVTAPGAGTPTGTITVSDGTAGCAITLPATTCSIRPVAAGVKTLVAGYGGDSHFAASTSAGASHTVGSVTTSPPLPTPTGTGSSTIHVGGDGCTLIQAGFIDVTPLSPPPNFSFPHGIADFAVGGCGSASVTVTVTYPQPLPAGAIYYRYGPIPTDPAPSWRILPTAAIVGNKVVFTLVDGQIGDNDLIINGVIRDAGGPAVRNAAAAEFYNIVLDHYFITADPGEASAIDRGSAGPGWSRTGMSFAATGSRAVCRFYGSVSPGPNSHFYTIDADECLQLSHLQAATPADQKRWNFESYGFLSTPPVAGTCPSGTRPVYRAYNNGFVRGIDSNHRITADPAGIRQVLTRGWIDEGVVMCAPSDGSGDSGGPAG